MQRRVLSGFGIMDSLFSKKKKFLEGGRSNYEGLIVLFLSLYTRSLWPKTFFRGKIQSLSSYFLYNEILPFIIYKRKAEKQKLNVLLLLYSIPQDR